MSEQVFSAELFKWNGIRGSASRSELPRNFPYGDFHLLGRKKTVKFLEMIDEDGFDGEFRRYVSLCGSYCVDVWNY